METATNCEILNENDWFPPDVVFKLIVIGETSVGKSCIIARATKNEYKEAYEVTIGAEQNFIYMKMHNKIIQFQLWDTAGIKKFRSMIKVFFKGSHGAFIVFDITRERTFDLLDVWLNILRDNNILDIKVIVIGNKTDLQEKREVTPEMGKEYVIKNGLYEYIETSAKTGEGVIPALTKMGFSLFNDSAVDDEIDEPKKEENNIDNSFIQQIKKFTKTIVITTTSGEKKKKGCAFQCIFLI